jgi:signal transduction histidine kinase
LRVEQGGAAAAAPDSIVDAGAIRRAALSAAADSAAAELAVAPDGGWPQMELRAGASLLCAAAELALHGGASPMRIAIPPALPATRLLSGMRRALLRLSREEALEPMDVLAMLDALETLSVELERDAGHRFSAQLGGTSGLELLVDVAHDMRSPLGSILFLAEQMRRGQSGAVTEVQERQLGLMYGAALGLSGLASDVMDLARGGATLIQREPRAFSMTGVFQSVRDLVLPMVEERGLVLRFETTVTDMRIGHGPAIQRVLLNLVTNAVKFTSVGEVAVVVTAASPTRVHFEVRDTGRGIPDEVLGSLFEVFRRRLKPGDYIFSSAGLGLGICQKLVRAMGGELMVESVTDVGCVFRFGVELPRSTAS